jgi:hypothetical protein
MGEWYDGYAFEHYGELRGVVEGAFRQLLKRGTRKKHPFSDPVVAEMWRYSQNQRRPKEDEDVELDDPAFNDLIVRLLQEAGTVQHDGVDHPGILGYEATLHVFHAQNPKTVYEAVLSKLSEVLALKEEGIPR